MIEFFQEEEYRTGYSRASKIILGGFLVGLISVVIGVVSFYSISNQIGGIFVIIGLIIMTLPYSISSYLKSRATNEMEDQFPEFLMDLAESKRGGMTLVDSFESAKHSNYGMLNPEIEKVHNQLTWGIPFPEVIERFSDRMKDSPVIQESLSIILQSYKSGGQITATIESVADNAQMIKTITQEKRSQLKPQVFVIHFIYFLFIGITVGIYILIQQLLGLGSPDPGTIDNVTQVMGEDGMYNFCNGDILYAQPFCNIAQIFGFVPPEITDLGSSQAEELAYGQMAYYKSVLFSMLMVQGICSSAVAGQISEGSPSAGVKHALIMLPLAFIVFMLVVRPMGF